MLRHARDVGAAAIRDREATHVRRAIGSWRPNPAIEILGDPDADRLPIVSFLLHTPAGDRPVRTADGFAACLDSARRVLRAAPARAGDCPVTDPLQRPGVAPVRTA